MIHIRKLMSNDIDCVVDIINEAKEIFKMSQINQWQNGYPNRQTIVDDYETLRAYVIESDGIIIGYFCLQTVPDPNYSVIRGAWHFDLPYATIHRFVISSAYRNKGIAFRVFTDLESLTELSVIRVDTALENIGMRSLLSKLGYKECGIVSVGDGERMAYDKNISYGKI